MKKRPSIYHYNDYRQYVKDMLDTKRGVGARSKLAKSIHCQPAFVSRVLSLLAQFSLEQALEINRFFGHSEDEGEYFVLLLQWDRAGTTELKSYFRSKMDALLQKRKSVKVRVSPSSEMSLQDQLTYYSTWQFAAVHILVGVAHLQTRDALARHLDLPIDKVSRVLDFLLTKGFIIEKELQLTDKKVPVHLSKDSPLVSKHHLNWRVQAMASLDNVKETDLHFTGIYSLSRPDKEKLQSVILEFIENADRLIRPSPEELGCVLNIDLFEL